MRRAFIAVVLTSIAGCAAPQPVTRGIEEPARMAEAVLGRIPVGTPVEEAQRFMEREGFDCYREADGATIGRPGLGYIYCNRSDGVAIKRRWQVAVVHRDGKVVDVLASTGLVGP